MDSKQVTEEKKVDGTTKKDMMAMITMAYDAMMAVEHYEVTCMQVRTLANKLELEITESAVQEQGAFKTMEILQAKVRKQLAGESVNAFIDRMVRASKAALAPRQQKETTTDVG